VSDSVFVHFDLARYVARDESGLTWQSFTRSHRWIVARENAVGAGELERCGPDVITVVLESRAQQLDDEPAIVPIADERRQAVTFAVDEPVGGGDVAKRIATTDGARDALVPPRRTDRCVGICVEESQRDFGFRTPECDAEWSSRVVG